LAPVGAALGFLVFIIHAKSLGAPAQSNSV
jgi:hypothetical protein